MLVSGCHLPECHSYGMANQASLSIGNCTRMIADYVESLIVQRYSGNFGFMCHLTVLLSFNGGFYTVHLIVM